MKTWKIVLLAGLLTAALICSTAWFASRLHTTEAGPQFRDSTMMAPDSTHAASSPDDVPAQLSDWIDASLWESGLWSLRDSFLAQDPARRTRLKLDSGLQRMVPVWRVDFSDLPVSVLGRGDEEDWSDFDVALSLSGTRVCGDISKWARKRASGLDERRCAGADDLALVKRWFHGNFRHEPSAIEISGPAGKRPTAVRVHCAPGDSLRDLRLLRTVGLDTLEIEACALGGSEQLALRNLALGRLVLRDVPDSVLALDESTVSREISIDGGNAQWISIPRSCPDGGDDCDWKTRRLRPGLSFHAARIPLCEPALVEELARKGVLLSEARCSDFPMELLAMRKKLEEEWTALVGDDHSSHLRPVFDSLSSDSLPSVPSEKPTFLNAQGIRSYNGCEDATYPQGFDINYARYGSGWIDDDQGRFLTGKGIQVTFLGRSIRAGMTRAQVIAVMGRPSIDEANFLAWAINGDCDQSDAGIRAHFNSKGELDGWFAQTEGGCDDC